MAKINLLTIHWGNCFGAVMQTYATCKVLKEKGHDVTVINLVPKSTLERFKKVRSYFNFDWLKDAKFLIFKHRYFPRMTSLMFSLNNSKLPEAEYSIVGSDQTWRPEITKDLWPNFFLDFADGTTRVSVSSSFGVEHFVGDVSKTKQFLKQFAAISVREDSGVKILSDTFGLESQQLLDPTLINQDYSELIRPRKNVPKYVYEYLLKTGHEEEQIVRKVSERLNIPIFEYDRINYKIHSGPIDRLNDIYYSSFVVVSSFHGLVFSLMFQKQFIVLCANPAAFTRLHSLLQLLHIEDRYVSSVRDLEQRYDYLLFQKIDYAAINEILSRERKVFDKFIDENIK